jgi:hypothetical protein
MARRSGSGLPDQMVNGSEAAPSSQTVTRITVALVAKAAADLRRTVARTHLSQTDIVNRALSLYEFIDSEMSSGGEVIIQRDGQEHRIVLL